MPMNVVDDSGASLAAEWYVEPDGDGLVLIMESSSGKRGDRRRKNPDYNAAQTVLLSRLAALDAVLTDALIDSRQTRLRGLTEAERRLSSLSLPVQLADVEDMEVFRRQISRAQSRVGQGPNATRDGNATKRIRLRVDISWAGPADADRLETALSTPEPQTPNKPQDAVEMMRQSGLGATYRQAQVSNSLASRELFSVDPALVERGLRGHADTQNELARVLSDAGIDPRSPLPGEPNFDLAWQNGETIFVAEVKSITDDNEEEQLRLGLGQVLRYRQRLATLGYRHVVAVLVPERQPRDPSWEQLCQDLGVALLWKEKLDSAPVM